MIRIFHTAVLLMLAINAQGQFFTGFGLGHNMPTADRLLSTSHVTSQLGFNWGDFAAVTEWTIVDHDSHWTVPRRFGTGRFEWRAINLAPHIPSLGLNSHHLVHFQLSIQQSIIYSQLIQSEHLVLNSLNQWTLERYKFQYDDRETLIGAGLNWRNKKWSALIEFQIGRGPHLDTWVYKSNLMLDGSEEVIDNYYYRESFTMIRPNICFRRDL